MTAHALLPIANRLSPNFDSEPASLIDYGVVSRDCE